VNSTKQSVQSKTSRPGGVKWVSTRHSQIANNKRVATEGPLPTQQSTTNDDQNKEQKQK